MFRTLPVFFVVGAGVEWFMIHVQIGKETFCKCIFPIEEHSSSQASFIFIDDTLVRKEAERRAERRKNTEDHNT